MKREPILHLLRSIWDCLVYSVDPKNPPSIRERLTDVSDVWYAWKKGY